MPLKSSFVVEEEKVKGIGELIDAIGAGNGNPYNPGPIVATFRLWDGRVVHGSYYRGKKTPHIIVPEDVIWNNEILRPFVQKLVEKGTPFVTETGRRRMVCALLWGMARR